MASRQYEFHYNMALVMAEQLKRAGMKPELQVVDWATLVQRRNDPKLWDIYITHSGQFPEPMLSPPQLSEGAPGWWSSPAKQAEQCQHQVRVRRSGQHPPPVDREQRTRVGEARQEPRHADEHRGQGRDGREGSHGRADGGGHDQPGRLSVT